MPELPEVEQVRRTLAPVMDGARLERVRWLRRDYCVLSPEFPSHRAAAAALEGRRVLAVERLGKHLSIVTEGPAMALHLGMSGRVQVMARMDAPRDPHVHVVWVVRRGRQLREVHMRDPRRFGGVWVYPSREALVESRWSGLGPDALDGDLSVLAKAAANSKRAIKGLLLDQSLLAGVGNIYADEALFASRIHPQTPGRNLTPRMLKRLSEAVREVLREAVEAGGSTLRDYVDANGNAGSYASLHRVYGRAGKPCVVCEKALIRTQVSQRTTTFCASCQQMKVGSSG